LDKIPANAEVGPLPPPNRESFAASPVTVILFAKSGSDFVAVDPPTVITYQHCQKIIELLQRTESGAKSWGGWGGFKVMRILTVSA